MAHTKAVIFDYIGTLVNCTGYTMEASMKSLYNALSAEGFAFSEEKFLAAYKAAHEKYRIVRYEQLKEVTNAVWIAEALCNLGYNVSVDDDRIKGALSVFFKAYIDSHQLRAGAKNLLKQARNQGKVGLISNFTHASVIYRSLRQMNINEFFNAVVVSEEVGWRKPSGKIFQNALVRLGVQPQEAIFIGDSPVEDIKGAKDAGLKTVFVPSQFYTLQDLFVSQQKPDYITKNLRTLQISLNQIMQR